MKPLNVKLEIFATVWAQTDNKSEAYRQMLPKSKALSESINTRAVNISKKIEVIARYKELKIINKELAEKEYGITEGRVLSEIARLAFNDPRQCFDNDGNLLPIKDWPDSVAATISSIKVVEKRDACDDLITQIKEVKFWDKGKQIELAAKTLGLLVEKKEVDVKSQVTEIQRIIIDEA